jgi:hypothetical protein
MMSGGHVTAFADIKIIAGCRRRQPRVMNEIMSRELPVKQAFLQKFSGHRRREHDDDKKIQRFDSYKLGKHSTFNI